MSIFKNGKTIENNRFVAIISGESGTGKTSQCRFLNPDETVILSGEEGLLCFKKYGYMPKLVASVKTVEDLEQAYDELSEGIDGIKNIFIDSLTEVAEVVLTSLKSDPKYADPKMALKMWGTYNDTMTKIIKSYRDLSQYNVIFTCLTEKAKDGLDTYDEFNLPGSALKSDLMSWFDICLHMVAYKDEDGSDQRVFLTSKSDTRLGKDRSGLLENTEPADLSAIINKIIKE